MGDDGGGMGGGGVGSPSPSSIGAEGLPVDTHGTSRDFGNMLNSYFGGRKKKATSRQFTPWIHMSKPHKVGESV